MLSRQKNFSSTDTQHDVSEKLVSLINMNQNTQLQQSLKGAPLSATELLPHVAVSSEMTLIVSTSPVDSNDSETKKMDPSDLIDSDIALCFDQMKNEPMTDFRTIWHTQLDSLAGDWFFNGDLEMVPPGQTETTIAGKFFLGLVKAGLFSKKIQNQNTEEALRLLSEVHLSDPRNSAPLLYMSVIEEKLGHSKMAEHYFDAAKSTLYFDSYIVQTVRSAIMLVKTPQEYVASIGVVANIPLPDYIPLRNTILKHKEVMFAKQLMQGGLDPAKKSDMLDWLVIEYVIGQTIMKKLGYADNWENYRNLIKKKNDPIQGHLDSMFSRARTNPCSINNFIPILKELERRYGK